MPVATCALQTISGVAQKALPQPEVLYTLAPLPADPLANYERTPLGDWRMPASVDRGDPWMRLALLGPQRPLVIDLAVFIDGKPFREAREAWIDELIAPEEDAGGNKSEETQGTNRAEATSDNKVSDPSNVKEETAKDAENAKDEDDGETEDDVEADPAGVQAQVRSAPTMRERLKSYIAASGAAVDREEIRWLIAEWGSGPAVLYLGLSLSWQRAGLAPLWAYLDGDSDGALSPAEIAAVAERMRLADIDANEVVDDGELRRAADRPAATPFATGHSMIVPLDATTDWEELSSTMSRVYGQDAGDRRRLGDGPADVTLRVDFATVEGPATGVSVVAIAAELGEAANVVAASPEVVTLDLGGDYIEFSAAQRKADGTVDESSSQLALGAVIDGRTLERRVDRDNDHRLTMRERQGLVNLLSTLDRDDDGGVGLAEMPVPIRFAVTLGPSVHELLATPVIAARRIEPRQAEPAAPAWFVSMDKNGDGDLSRREFLGTSEQFRKFDGDADGLLTVAEALKVNPGQ